MLRDYVAGERRIIVDDGTQTLDKLYAGDIRGRAGASTGVGGEGGLKVFNIGRGTERSVNEFAGLMKETIGTPRHQVRTDVPRQL